MTWQQLFTKLADYAPAIAILIRAFDDPTEALQEMRSLELRKRAERDKRMGRG